LELVTGDYTGTHVFPDWYDRVTWIGDPSIIPYRVSVGYRWNPDTDRLAYFHCFADYTEDDEHIRYVDRTFTEDWSKSFTSIDVLYDWENMFYYISVGGIDDVKLIVTNPDDTVVEYPMNSILTTATQRLQSKDAMYGSIISMIATSNHPLRSLNFRRTINGR